jgi:hypothetical protein
MMYWQESGLKADANPDWSDVYKLRHLVRPAMAFIIKSKLTGRRVRWTKDMQQLMVSLFKNPGSVDVVHDGKSVRQHTMKVAMQLLQDKLIVIGDLKSEDMAIVRAKLSDTTWHTPEFFQGLDNVWLTLKPSGRMFKQLTEQVCNKLVRLDVRLDDVDRSFMVSFISNSNSNESTVYADLRKRTAAFFRSSFDIASQSNLISILSKDAGHASNAYIAELLDTRRSVKLAQDVRACVAQNMPDIDGRRCVLEALDALVAAHEKKCAYAGCASHTSGVKPDKYMVCDRCKIGRFCDATCQRAAWRAKQYCC